MAVVDDHGTRGPRLLDDGARLWKRVQKFLALGLIPDSVDRESLELACMALQLPMKAGKPPAGKKARTSLRDRADDAAELLITHAKDHIDDTLLDRATRLLHEMAQRAPMLDEARILADALNLEDFGMTGLVLQVVALGCQGDGVAQLADGCEKREQYGYWEARLKDGFHFEPIRQLARKRLDHARKAAAFLQDELREDTRP
jgi:hypothetical protein